MEHTRDSNRRIVITVSKKPHGESVADTPEPPKPETAAQADDQATRDSLAVLASLYRILRG